MNCNETQVKISEWIDGDLHYSEESQLRGHLELCPKCSLVCQDLKAIRRSASLLEPLEPSDKVWAGIQSELLAESLIKPARRRNFWEKIFAPNFRSSLKPALSGAIVTLILVGSFYLLFTQFGSRGTSIVHSPEAAVFQELKVAELHYLQAIEALNEVSQRKLQLLDPALAQIFNDNLATMDYYLKECKETVRSNPDNPLVHRYLLAAYQKKVELMQTIANFDSL